MSQRPRDEHAMRRRIVELDMVRRAQRRRKHVPAATQPTSESQPPDHRRAWLALAVPLLAGVVLLVAGRLRRRRLSGLR
jgi:hypothetical protein